MSDKLKVVLCWHMHQPQYNEPMGGSYQLPWTYLHAIKDYVDMAHIISTHPKAKAVVNFAPILLEQLDDYTAQLNQFFADHTPIKDPLLNALASEEISTDPQTQKKIMTDCLRANEQRLIKRFPRFESLTQIAKEFVAHPHDHAYLEKHFISDLLMWYHLAWLGETIRRDNKKIQALMIKEHHFTYEDRTTLLSVMHSIIKDIIPSYRRLAEKGQIELAFSPYAHPIVPLLCDFNSAHDAMPHAPLPKAPQYPGGEARAMWHINKGIASFKHHFGHKPRGCWPSEGGVCEETVRLCSEYGIDWLASGESVMRNSLGQSPALQKLLEGECLHRSYQLKDNRTRCFFRDDGLSDLIGFTYSGWHADDAINNLIHHIENVAEACEYQKDTVIPIILDGENAWEHYPENGFYFLNALYERLSTHPGIEITTFSECIDNAIEPVILDNIVAGSWVYGTFSTWIGEADKNIGWDLLVEAKHAYDKVIADGKLSSEQQELATQQLSICEGSDWFWWFGDYNPADSVADFEQLFRTHLIELYQLLEEPVPENLNKVISIGGGTPATGGVMRHGKEGSD